MGKVLECEVIKFALLKLIELWTVKLRHLIFALIEAFYQLWCSKFHHELNSPLTNNLMLANRELSPSHTCLPLLVGNVFIVDYPRGSLHFMDNGLCINTLNFHLDYN
jgi:hypothetical protein